MILNDDTMSCLAFMHDAWCSHWVLNFTKLWNDYPFTSKHYVLLNPYQMLTNMKTGIANNATSGGCCWWYVTLSNQYFFESWHLLNADTFTNVSQRLLFLSLQCITMLHGKLKCSLIWSLSPLPPWYASLVSWTVSLCNWIFSLLMSGMAHLSGTVNAGFWPSVLASDGSAIACERFAIWSCLQACHVIWTFGLYCCTLPCWLSDLLLAILCSAIVFAFVSQPGHQPCQVWERNHSVKNMIAFLAGKASYPLLCSSLPH